MDPRALAARRACVRTSGTAAGGITPCACPHCPAQGAKIPPVNGRAALHWQLMSLRALLGLAAARGAPMQDASRKRQQHRATGTRNAAECTRTAHKSNAAEARGTAARVATRALRDEARNQCHALSSRYQVAEKDSHSRMRSVFCACFRLTSSLVLTEAVAPEASSPAFSHAPPSRCARVSIKVVRSGLSIASRRVRKQRLRRCTEGARHSLRAVTVRWPRYSPHARGPP